jgi:hypothetical protein
MNLGIKRSERTSRGLEHGCVEVRSLFSAYLDGDKSGIKMAAISKHLQLCDSCASEFKGWCEVQGALGQLRAIRPPETLQMRLRSAIAVERERGSHLPYWHRALRLWETSLSPVAVRVSRGLAAALVLAGGLTWLFAAPLAAVRASDDAMGHLVAPHYMYSQVPPQIIETRHDAPIVVEALVDSRGRVYDYSILEGPQDEQIRVRVANNLLSSIFQPATVFGVPVRGHVVLTYTGVSVNE